MAYCCGENVYIAFGRGVISSSQTLVLFSLCYEVFSLLIVDVIER